MGRKYSTKKKTTTPEGYREYMKLYMRDVRRRRQDQLKQLKLQFPDAWELIFGKKRKRR